MKNMLSDFSIKGWKKLKRGVVTLENPIMIGMISNPIDYLLDGYTFINKNKVKSVEIINDSTQQRIMSKKSKTWSNNYSNLNNVCDFQELFEQLKKGETFCELYLSKEDRVYIGKIVDVRADSIDVDFYTTDFKLLDEAVVEFKDIKLVTIYSDYSTTFENVIMKNI